MKRYCREGEILNGEGGEGSKCEKDRTILINIMYDLYFEMFIMVHNGASSGCKWRKHPPDMEGSCEYIESAVADTRQGVALQLGGWAWG
jgi:hypothetical protein